MAGAIGGAVGAYGGAKVANSMASSLEDLSSLGNLGDRMASLTRDASVVSKAIAPAAGESAVLNSVDVVIEGISKVDTSVGTNGAPEQVGK